MSKILNRINLAVDFVMFLTFLIAGFSAIVADKILPRNQGHVNIFWGIKRGTWMTIHSQTGYLLIVLILIHLGLHWRWFLYQITKIKALFKE